MTILISPETRRGTPSIMCGFALAMAIIMAAYVAPLYTRETEAMRTTPVLS